MITWQATRLLVFVIGSALVILIYLASDDPFYKYERENVSS